MISLERAFQRPKLQPDCLIVFNFLDALTAGKTLPFNAPELSGEDLIYLQYTGGTTGLSKGAMLSHGNLVANILQFESFAGDYIRYGEDVVITAIPMYHIFALMVNTLSYFKFGANNVMIADPADMPAFVAEWSRWPVSVFTGVNTLYNGLLHTPGFSALDFSALRISVGGGAAVQKAVSDRWKSVTGRHIKEGYGLSETSPVLTVNPFGSSDFKNSIGCRYRPPICRCVMTTAMLWRVVSEVKFVPKGLRS